MSNNNDAAGLSLPTTEGPNRSATALACPTPIYFGPLSVATGEMFAPLPRPCRRPSCPVCGDVLRRSQSAWYTDQFSGREGLLLISLTVDSSTVRAIGAADLVRGYLAHTFSSSFLPRLARRAGRRAVYVAAVERHRSGTPHLHALLDTGLDEDAVRMSAYSAGFGASMSVQPVGSERRDVAQAVRYVLKSAFGPSRSANSSIRFPWAGSICCPRALSV